MTPTGRCLLPLWRPSPSLAATSKATFWRLAGRHSRSSKSLGVWLSFPSCHASEMRRSPKPSCVRCSDQQSEVTGERKHATNDFVVHGFGVDRGRLRSIRAGAELSNTSRADHHADGSGGLARHHGADTRAKPVGIHGAAVLRREQGWRWRQPWRFGTRTVCSRRLYDRNDHCFHTRINPSLYGSKLPFDALNDFEFLAVVAELKNVVVVSIPRSGQHHAGVVRYAKDNPGKINFGSAGVGTSQHMAGELFKHLAKDRHQPCGLQGRGAGGAGPRVGRDPAYVLEHSGHAGIHSSGQAARHRHHTKKRSPVLPDVVPVPRAGLSGFRREGLVRACRAQGNAA